MLKMESRRELDNHVRARAEELEKLKSEGKKIIGVAPTGYLPDELVLASGAVPVGLIRGGDSRTVAGSAVYSSRFWCTFWRSQIGYWALKEEPIYQMLDLFVIPITDHNVRWMGDIFYHYSDVPVFYIGVPHQKSEVAFEYYLGWLYRLKDKLEEVTGNKIEDSKLREAIDLCNRERAFFREISLMRKAERPPITGKEFVTLNHASYIADKRFMVESLESISAELKKKEGPLLQGPRIMLTGSTLAMGDYQMLDMLEETGAGVVIEHYDDALKPYWENVKPNGNLMEALADCYFRRRVCHAAFRPPAERRDFIIKLCKDFKVDGIVHYMPMYRDCWENDYILLADKVKNELGLPMLNVETDYDANEVGPLRTRVETHIQMLAQ